jgi:hypothetical protein
MPEETHEAEVKEDALRDDLRAGIWIFFLLAVFTVGEFVAAVVSPTLGWLLIIAALPKAFFVIMDYMHLPRLFGGDEENH